MKQFKLMSKFMCKFKFKSIFIGVLSVCFFSIVFSDVTFSKRNASYNSNRTQSNKSNKSNKYNNRAVSFSNFEEKYRNTVQLESLKMYTKAQKEYIELNTYFFEMYPLIKNDSDVLFEVLPIVISSVFRLSETTSRSNYSNMFQLVHQISSFKTVHNHIEQLLTIIMDLRKDYPSLFPKSIYSPLLYARGLNRISWANKLLEGIPWKNYVVFPPQDIIGMLEMAVDDFEQLLEFEEMPIEFNSYPESISRFAERFLAVDNVDYKDYSRLVLARFMRFKQNSLVYNTHRFVHLTDDYTVLAEQVSKRYYHNVFSVLKFYQSKSVQRVLKKTQKAHTLEDILNPKNRVIFDVFLKLVDLVEIRKY